MKTLITTHKEYQELFPTGGCVIEESDKFKNEICIHTFNLHKEWIVSDDYSYLPCGSFSVMFQSNPKGESLALVSTHNSGSRFTTTNPRLYSDASAIININDTENIVLNEVSELYENELIHSVFSISKQDFEKCCHAKTMSIRLMKSEDEIGRQFDDISTLILAFRTIWNKAIDNSIYSDSVVEFENVFKNIVNESSRVRARRDAAAKSAPKKKKGFLDLILFSLFR